jgi:hypothetical protein
VRFGFGQVGGTDKAWLWQSGAIAKAICQGISADLSLE